MGKLSGGVLSSDFQYLPVCKFCHSARFAFKVFVAALVHHVFDVVLLSARAKVRWIAASSLSDARMQNELSGRNSFPVVDNPRDLMGSQSDPSSHKSDTDLPVTVICRSVPKPAFIRARLVHSSPKLILEVFAQKLRQQFRGDSLGLHQSSWLIVCQAPGSLKRGGIFILPL
jgi:hypothetical protein